jgi:hypothetical protein
MGIKQKEPKYIIINIYNFRFYLQVELDFTEIPENDF